MESVLRNMINAPAGLSQDVAQWLVLIKRLQVSSGFWLHCGENKWGVCDASYVTMKEPTVRELQGMSPHVLHLSGARSRAIYHIHKYSEITLRIIHADTCLCADALAVKSVLGDIRSPAVESQRPFLAQTGSARNTGYGNLSTTPSDRRVFFPQMRGLSRNWREYLSRVETPLCVITFSSVTIKEAAAQWPSLCFSTNGIKHD